MNDDPRLVDSVAELARRIVARPIPQRSSCRIVAVDGPGGAGKSTLAGRLAAALGGIPVVPTDDFATWDEPLGWWPDFVESVLGPLASGARVRYSSSAWPGRPPAVVEFGPCTLAIVEGVSSGRRDFAPFLSSLVWVEAPRPLRLARGLERDGAGAAAQWQSWIAAEDEYFAVHEPDRHADFVVDGAADLPEEQVPD